MNIVLCGFMGAGKTRIGKEISKLTGREFIDTDDIAEKSQAKNCRYLCRKRRGRIQKNRNKGLRGRGEARKRRYIDGRRRGNLSAKHGNFKKSGTVVFIDTSFPK